ncbi:hypothetical protein JTB14_000248 [Gonioctena quinquepunctata]|nr:hypothetical protein JTB14_000248 [Gonioctena quinquepunctata]
MVKIKKKEKSTNFRSIDGNTLKLYVEDKPVLLRVVIFNSYKPLYKKCIVLLFLVSIELTSLIFNFGSLYVIIVILFIILLGYRICYTAIEENLVIVKGLGINVETKYIMGSKSQFIPQEQVQNIFINEVILRSKVIYMLTLLTIDGKTKENLFPLFEGTLPRLGLLTVVYNLIRKFNEYG